MRHLKRLLHLVVTLLAVGATAHVVADEIDDILSAETAPPGIVFEVVSGDPDRLKDVLPVIQENIQRLRKRFPGLDIAIVTHGEEQFALTTDNRKSAPKLHAIAETLVDDELVSLHVCQMRLVAPGREMAELLRGGRVVFPVKRGFILPMRGPTLISSADRPTKKPTNSTSRRALITRKSLSSDEKLFERDAAFCAALPTTIDSSQPIMVVQVALASVTSTLMTGHGLEYMG